MAFRAVVAAYIPAALLAITASSGWLAAPALAASGLPDQLTAGRTEVSPDGLVHASGGVTLRITSLVEGGELVITADEVDYDSNTGAAELRGNVELTLAGTELSLTCRRFSYDPLMERMEAEGIQLALPMPALIEEGRLPQGRLLLANTHYYNIQPETLYFAAGRLEVERNPREQKFVLRDVRLTHHSHSDPDLYLHAEQVELMNDSQVVVRDVDLRVAGIEVATWSRFSRNLKPEPRMLSFDFPMVNINRDVGISWRQSVKLDMDQLKSDGLLDISTDYGIIGYAYTYTMPAPDASLGVAYGSRTVVDVRRRAFERRDEGTAVYYQRLTPPQGPVEEVLLNGEFGKTVSSPREYPLNEPVPERVEDTRLHASADVSFEAVPLAGDLSLATGAYAALSDYQDADVTYTVVGGRAGLIFENEGFLNYLVYQANEVSGRALFPFDEVRQQEVDFAASFRLHPSWHHVVQGVYDLDRDEFDKLQIGAMKRQKTFEIGLYWDFARKDAGLEFGLLYD